MIDPSARLFGLLLLVTLSPAPVTADEPAKPVAVTTDHYRVYHGDGRRTTLGRLLREASASDLVFLGENHDDPVAHHLEASILRQLAERSDKDSRPLALSLEMFERDVQHVLDEYLAGLITEDHLKKSGRSWENYEKDYRPMVEFAKKHKLPAIAANAPRRYVTLVGREGMDVLNQIEHPAQRGLPPLPYAKASATYAEKFKAIMEKHTSGASAKEPKSDKPSHKPDLTKSLQAQSLWDASMAYSIAEHLLRSPNSRVLHVNGSFHTANRLGIVEHLLRYRPGTKVLVVTMVPSKDFPKFDAEKMAGSGDFVIVTDERLPRSYGSPKKE